MLSNNIEKGYSEKEPEIPGSADLISPEKKPEEGTPKTPETAEIEKKEEEKSILKTELLKTFDEIVSYAGDAFKTGETGEIKPENKERLGIAYKRAQGFVYEITRGDLNKKIRDEARAEAELQGKKIVGKNEYYSDKNIVAAERKTQVKRWGKNIQANWAGLTDEEKKDFGNDLKKYAEHLEEQRKELEKKGISMTRDVYYELLRKGYDPSGVEIKGIFKKSIVIPYKDGSKTGRIPVDDFKKWIAETQKNATDSIKEETRRELDKRYAEGRTNWMKRKIKKAGEIITNIACPPAEDKEVAKDVVRLSKPEKVRSKENISLEDEEKMAEERYETRTRNLFALVQEMARKFKLSDPGKNGLLAYAKTGEMAADVPRDIIPEQLLDAIKKKNREILEERQGVNIRIRQRMVQEIEAKLAVI